MTNVDCYNRSKHLSGAVALIGMLAFALFVLPGWALAQDVGPSALPDTIGSRVLACTACHGKEGQGANDDYFPRIAGKPANYLYNQLVAFRVGRRKYPPMNYLLAYLPDSYLQEMAAYFAKQQPPFPTLPKPEVSAAVLAHGEALVLKGDPTRDVPACISCHGKAMTGMLPNVPGLLGLHSRYISAQIGAARYGTRTSENPDCMQEIASRLNDDDVTAVAAWLSSRPAPTNPAPLPESSLKMPLVCGGSETK